MGEVGKIYSQINFINNIYQVQKKPVKYAYHIILVIPFLYKQAKQKAHRSVLIKYYPNLNGVEIVTLMA